jgi:hypothetical protein
MGEVARAAGSAYVVDLRVPSREGKVGCSAALIVGLCSSASLAADEREPIRLIYAAQTGCPSPADFEAFVLERASRARAADTQEIAREYRVSVRTLGRTSVARLEFAAADGGTVSREVSAGDCAEAVRAIAVVTALAFDAAVAGAANGRPDPKPGAAPAAAVPEAEPSPPETHASPSAPPKQAANDAPKRRPAPRRVSRSEPAPPARREARRPVSSQRLDFELGARATLTSSKAPRVLPGAELFAGVADPRSKWSVQLGLAAERGARTDSGPGEARFSFVGGRLEGCFFGVALADSWALAPCALLEGGAVVVEGFIEGEERSIVDPWFAVGLNARVGWKLGSVTARLEGGPLFPLRLEDRVVFGSTDTPRKVVHDVDWIGAFVALGLAWGSP